MSNNDMTEAAFNQVVAEEKLFELAQRKAQIYAKSSLVPKEYQNNIGNVLIAENMARRMGADTLMVMQNLYVVHGKPGWSATFLIASFNSNGKFSAIKYRFRGEQGTEEWGCQAYCTELATGEEISGTWVTWTMAMSEGWVSKSGSKWKTMPEQMFRYRAATFLIRSTAPEIGMGLLTKDELEDMGPQNGMDIATKTIDKVADLRERLALAQAQDVAVEAATTDEPTPIETEIVQETAPDFVSDADDAEATAQGLDPDADPLESLRANVKSALDGLPKQQQKDVMAGRPYLVKSATEAELRELLAAIQEYGS